MKRKLLILLFLTFAFAMKVNASGSISVSKTDVTMYKGDTTTIKVSGKNVAGLVEVSSNNSTIASVNIKKYFFDTSLGNSSVTVKITAKKVGKTEIQIKLKDIATFDGEELTGVKKISVKVKEKPTTITESNTDNKNKTEEAPKEIKIKKFEIVGYDLNFDKNNHDYDLNIDNNVKSLYILVEGKNFKVTGDKVVNIAGKDMITVSLSGDKEKLDYNIRLNRIDNSNNNCVCNCPQEEKNTCDCPKEELKCPKEEEKSCDCGSGDFCFILLVSIPIIIIILMLLIIFREKLKLDELFKKITK